MDLERILSGNVPLGQVKYSDGTYRFYAARSNEAYEAGLIPDVLIGTDMTGGSPGSRLWPSPCAAWRL